MSQPKAWNPDVHTADGLTQPILSSSVIGTVLVDVGRGAPIRLQIFGGDDPAQAAADFCAAYRKGVRARKKLLAAIQQSMTFVEEQVAAAEGEEGADEDWCMVNEAHEVAVDLRFV